MTALTERSSQEHPEDSGRPAATAQPWQVAWRMMLRRGVVLDPETAQGLADNIGLALQPDGQPAPARPRRQPRRPRPESGPEAGCDPLW